MKKKNKEAMKKSLDIAKQWQEENNSDVLGSYTGNPEENDIRPVQDADDL